MHKPKLMTKQQQSDQIKKEVVAQNAKDMLIKQKSGKRWIAWNGKI